MIVPLSYRLLVNDRQECLVYEKDLNGFLLLFLIALPLVSLSFLVPTIVADERNLLGLLWLQGTFFLLMVLFVALCGVCSSSKHQWLVRYRLRQAPLATDEVAAFLLELEKEVPHDGALLTLLSQEAPLFTRGHLLLTSSSPKLSRRLRPYFHKLHQEEKKRLLEKERAARSRHQDAQATAAVERAKQKQEAVEAGRHHALKKDATEAEVELTVLEAWQGDKQHHP